MSPAKAGLNFFGDADPGATRYALAPGYLMSRLQRDAPGWLPLPVLTSCGVVAETFTRLG